MKFCGLQSQQMPFWSSQSLGEQTYLDTKQSNLNVNTVYRIKWKQNVASHKTWHKIYIYKNAQVLF